MLSVSPLRGEIWIADTPGRHDDPHRPRPVIVISDNVRNAHRDHGIVVPIYSEGKVGLTHLGIRAGMGALAHDSVVFCEEISTVDYHFFRDGPLGPPVPRVHPSPDYPRGARRLGRRHAVTMHRQTKGRYLWAL